MSTVFSLTLNKLVRRSKPSAAMATFRSIGRLQESDAYLPEALAIVLPSQCRDGHHRACVDAVAPFNVSPPAPSFSTSARPLPSVAVVGLSGHIAQNVSIQWACSTHSKNFT
uniref:Uncharacterized protein n=1 Tax=Arundo donax TaxID=35708 RepID=A0A0A8Z6F2_ARUDO